MRLIFILFMVSFLSCKSNNFTIHGTLKDKSKIKVYLGYLDYEKTIPIFLDSVYANDGEFIFEGTVDKMRELGLMNEKSDQYSIPFFIEEGENVIKEDNSKDRDISFGVSIINQPTKDKQTLDSIISEFYAAHETFYKKYNELMAVVDDEIKSSKPYTDSLDILDNKDDSLRKMVIALEEKFIKDHPKSYFSAFYLYYPFGFTGQIEQKMELYKILDEDVKNSYYGKLLSSHFEKQYIVGKVAPEITGIDTKNESFKLSNFKGKYILIDFWASWCVPCRKSNKKLLTWYNDFAQKNNLEIVCISLDDSELEWKKAIKMDGIGDWYQLIRSNTTIGIEDYSVSTIPNQFLIGPDGKILKEFLSDPDLIKTLEKYVAQK
jgi:peroxiredoxin